MITKLVFVALSALACGSPEELGDGFPPLEQTGYDDDGNGGAPSGGVSGTGGGQPQAGTGGTPGQGGTGGNPSGGSGGGSPGGGGPGGAGSGPGGAGPVGGSGGGNPGGAGGGEPPVVGACPDDISELFARPITEGGCDGQGCHIPGPTGTPPDLVSPNPAERLLNVMSSCGGRPYIGADDSFLVEKITVAVPACGGAAMPFFMASALSPEDEACIIAWVDEISGN